MNFYKSIGLSAALLAAAAGYAAPHHRYQRVKPVTDRNIGRNLLKYGRGSRPRQGQRETARRRRQMEAGQLSIRAIVPTGHPGKAFAKQGGIR